MKIVNQSNNANDSKIVKEKSVINVDNDDDDQKTMSESQQMSQQKIEIDFVRFSHMFLIHS